MSNTSIRDSIKQKRRLLTADVPTECGQTISHTITQLHAFIEAKSVAFYYPNENEVDCFSLVAMCRHQQKSCYLPTLNQDKLTFSLWDANSILRANRFGIPESTHPEQKNPNELDLVLVPLVAFTEDCHRLGMGAGFYDKTFADRLKQPAPPLLIGIAYDWQRMPSIQINDWDVPMDMIVTEKRVYWPGQ
jgi:5-formyltetrahydrofolate cyclo-ligase